MTSLRSFCLFNLCAFLTGSLAGAEPMILKVWPDKPPGPVAKVDGPEIDRQKPTDRLVGGKTVMKIGNVSAAEIHVYHPPADKANGAACVICPGGGYHILAWDLEGTEVAEWLNSLGVTAIVLKYRVPTGPHGDPGKWQGPVMDAQRTLSLARSHADEWSLDPARIGILGFSAGGNLAGHVAVKNGNRQYDSSDKIDEASCAPNFAILIYPAYFVDQAGNLLPDFTVGERTPPMFFVHAANDGVTCLSSVMLFAELKKAGVLSELHVYPTGGHGYGLRPTEEAVTHWPQRAGNWLRETGMLSSQPK
ncbi:MAG TPA: alpha/beta hydrolase [Planctomycetaceae bacterium]|nr:alpha/beta hydrolase [Planctomycetaceae bacterium]